MYASSSSKESVAAVLLCCKGRDTVSQNNSFSKLTGADSVVFAPSSIGVSNMTVVDSVSSSLFMSETIDGVSVFSTNGRSSQV